MIAFAYYLFKVVICSGVLFLYYHIALRNKLFHHWNRFYLLLAVIISLVAPIVQIAIVHHQTKDINKAIQLIQVVQSADGYLEEVTIGGHPSVSLNQWLMMIYAMASTIFLFSILLSLKKIRTIIRSHAIQRIEDIKFVNTKVQGTPFSFFHFIFWNEKIDLQTETGQQIFQHELVHVKEKHTLDKLFIQFVLMFFWINPFFWLIRRELKLIHEFIADQKAVGEHGTAALAAMILNASYPSQFNSITNQFFQTSIKRRLAMLTKIQNPRINYLSRVLALPLLAITVLAFTLRTKNAATIPSVKLDKQLVVVIDAGHGLDNGKYNGASNSNVYEDEITLAIANKIKELNTNGQLKIVLTRPTEQIVDLHKRVDIAKENNADLFISIHVNAAVPNQNPDMTSPLSVNKGFEICVSNKQTRYQQQSELLGSVLEQELKSVYYVNPSLLKRKVGVWVLDQNVCPSVLLECGFITNENDKAFITKEKNQEAVAQKILKAIERYALSQESFKENSSGAVPANDTAIIQTDNYKGDKYKAIRINGKLQELWINDKPVPKDQLAQYESTVDNIQALLLQKRENASQKTEEKFQTLKNPLLYIVNGKEFSGSLNDINVNSIESISVLKGDTAKEKAANGAIEIKLKEAANSPISKAVINQMEDTIPKNEPIFTKLEKEASVDKEEWSKFLSKNLQSFIESVASME